MLCRPPPASPSSPCDSLRQGKFTEERDMLTAARFPASALLLVAGLPLANRAGAQTPVPADPVDFERHVMGVFGRMGCNMGSCHGSFQGKGGFRLSLFGYAPDKDYVSVTRDNF